MALKLEPRTRLVVATHNPGKVRELAEILENRFELVTAGELGLAEPDETETTFAGNALLKARTAADASGLIALADDSGLSVAALDGAPGIYSARWAGPDKDFALAMRKVEERLEPTADPDRAAWFTCALAVAWPYGAIVAVEGQVHGHLRFPSRGRLRQAQGGSLLTDRAPPLAVYVHWPYCARICPYCDFNVIRDRGQPEQ